MGWTKNKSRIEDGIYAGEFLTSIHNTQPLSWYKIGHILGMSSRQLIRCSQNKQRISQVKIELLIDTLIPCTFWTKTPKIHGNEEIGPNTWTVGVGEATLRAASTGHW